MHIFPLIVIIIIYLAVIASLGWAGYRQTRNSADYLVGGRSVHPYIMAMSYGATFISTSAIVGFGGVSSMYGMSLLWLAACNIIVGIFLAFIVYGKRTRRMGLNIGAQTFPEFLSRRVGSPFIQWFGGLVIFIFMPVYTAAVLIGAARIMEGLLGIPFIYSVTILTIVVAAYVIMGGIKSVMYADAFQGTLMLGGMLFLLIFIYYKLGGIVEAHSALTAMADMVPENLRAIGHQGWTKSPASGSPLWWVIYSSLVFGVGIGVLAQPQLAVRYMTVKSDKEIHRAVLIGGLFILVCVGTTYVVGPLSNVYFMKTSGQLAIQAAGGNPDSVMPLLISDVMPTWFAYLFMLVIISAAMSTLSSLFHTVGTAVGRDVLEYGIMKGKTKAGGVLITRVGMVLSIIFTVLLSLRLGPGIIARATAIFFGIMASGFLAPYTASLFWKRLTRRGAIAGIVSGLGVQIFAYLFLHAKEAAVFGICEALTGKVTLLGGIWDFVDPLVFGLPVSIIVTIAVSLCTKVEDPEIVDKCFAGIGK